MCGEYLPTESTEAWKKLNGTYEAGTKKKILFWAKGAVKKKMHNDWKENIEQVAY